MIESCNRRINCRCVRVYVSMLGKVYYREVKIWNSDGHTLVELSKDKMDCLMRQTDWLIVDSNVLSGRVISIINNFFSLPTTKLKTN